MRGRQRGVPRWPADDRERPGQPGHRNRRTGGGTGLMRRGTGRERTPFQVGAVTLVILGILVYLGFSKDIPLVNPPYALKGVFADAQNMPTRSPVRRAGVEVGQVTKGEEYSDDSDLTVVTMEIKDEGLPIHENAELKIRPRIFLEGNFFVELDPGTDSAAEFDSGDMVPASQTSGTVQLDEVLTSL